MMKPRNLAKERKMKTIKYSDELKHPEKDTKIEPQLID